MSVAKHAEKEFLKISTDDLVKQICLKDSEIYNDIKIAEIQSFNWAKESKKNQCPSLMLSTKQFNKINIWVQNEILHSEESKRSLKVLCKFIKLAKKLLDHRNFQSAYAIKAALDSASIQRLESLWGELNGKQKCIWDKVRTVFNVEDNHKNLREEMQNDKLPSIPYLGLYFFDLVNIDAAYPKNDVDKSKHREAAMEKIYVDIEYFKKSKYDFKKHTGIQAYLDSMEYMEEFQNVIIDNLYYLSKRLEPDEESIKTVNSATNPVHFSPQVPFSKGHRKAFSLERPGSGSYRMISDKERENTFYISRGSSTLVQNDANSTSPLPRNSRNLLDDSEFPSFGDMRPKPTLTQSISVIAKSSENNSSPELNSGSKFGSLRSKIEFDTKSDVQYSDADSSLISQNSVVVIEGYLKRKTKLRNSTLHKCVAQFQKVLVKLCIDKMECYLTFHTPKIPKPKCTDDFTSDIRERIYITNSEIKYDSLINQPTIQIILAHDVHKFKSIEDSESTWPTIDSWYTSIKETMEKVKSLKAAAMQPHCDLINLEDEFTRL